MVAFLCVTPVGETFKIYMLVQVALSPGRDLDMFIFVEAAFIAVVDLIICIGIIVGGVYMKKHFKFGLKGLHSNKDYLQRPIFQ